MRLFVDAAAIIAILSDEPESGRCAKALSEAAARFTSAIAVWEAAMALSRTDKFALPLATCQEIVVRFLEDRAIDIAELPPATTAVELSLDAAARYRSGPVRLNLADCFHYACARHAQAAMLSTADEFRFTDLETVA